MTVQLLLLYVYIADMCEPLAVGCGASGARLRSLAAPVVPVVADLLAADGYWYKLLLL